MTLTKLSLFSGIGGDDLASEWAGIKTICFVEKDKYCQKVLKKHWPDIPLIEDVKDVTKENIRQLITNTSELRCDTWRTEQSLQGVRESSETSWGRITDIVSGGFPCQPHSVAGKRKGSLDERNLWPEFRRVIGEIKPRWVVAENVPGLFSSDAGRFFGEVLADLAQMGYSAGWCTFGAVDVGALHRRNRVFIVGYAEHAGHDAAKITRSVITRSYGSKAGENATGELAGPGEQSDVMADPAITGLEGAESAREVSATRLSPQCGDVPDTACEYCNRSNGSWQSEGYGEPGRCPSPNGGAWAVEPRLGGMVDGFSYWSHEPDGIPRVATGVKNRVDRLKGLGNAVVPQQIYPIYKAIAEIAANR